MSAENLPVIAAIPNFNRAPLLPFVIRPLLEQEYDGVVVMDDASTDVSIDVLRQYRSDIEIVRGLSNVGSGANRNRVMESQTLLKTSRAVLHFIDADTVVTSDRTPERIREYLYRPGIGVMGGLVLNTDGAQFSLNYGPNLAGPIRVFKTYGTGAVQQAIERVSKNHQELAARLRSRLHFIVNEWPDTSQPPVARNVGWVAEANMMMDSDLFRSIGGFDPILRFGEIQELTRQLERRGLLCRFEPDIQVVHKEGNVLGMRRYVNEAKSVSRLALRYASSSARKPVTM